MWHPASGAWHPRAAYGLSLDARACPIPRSGHRRPRRKRGVPWSLNRIDSAAAAQGHGRLPEGSCLSRMHTPSWEPSSRDRSPAHSCPGPSCLGRFLVLTPVAPDGISPTAHDRPRAPASRALRRHHHGPLSPVSLTNGRFSETPPRSPRQGRCGDFPSLKTLS